MGSVLEEARRAFFDSLGETGVLSFSEYQVGARGGQGAGGEPRGPEQQGLGRNL
jgi:hypothetical protein